MRYLLYISVMLTVVTPEVGQSCCANYIPYILIPVMVYPNELNANCARAVRSRSQSVPRTIVQRVTGPLNASTFLQSLSSAIVIVDMVDFYDTRTTPWVPIMRVDVFSLCGLVATVYTP